MKVRLNDKDWNTILESLLYSKVKLGDYKYENKNFGKERLKDIEKTVDKVRRIRK